MKKTSKIMSLVLAGVMVLSMSTCGSNTAETTADITTVDIAAATATEVTKTSKRDVGGAKKTSAQATDDTVYKIGVPQPVQHMVLDTTDQGFIATLGDARTAYEVDQQNAPGDQSACQTVASKFTSDKEDLILAIVILAAQATAGVVSDAPVPMATVTDPAESGLMDTNKRPGGNVIGTSDLTPVKEQAEPLQKILSDARKMGILYCSAGSNSEVQAQTAKEAIEAARMTSQDFTVSSFSEIQTVVQSVTGKVGAIYAPAGNTTAAGMTTADVVAGGNKLPAICGEFGMMEDGGLTTYGIDYYQLGYMTGQQVVRTLTEGASPADMSIEYLPAKKYGLTVNEETASILGIDMSNLK